MSTAPVYRAVKCLCRRCGALVVITAGWDLSGECDRCGSDDLKPISPFPYATTA